MTVTGGYELAGLYVRRYGEVGIYLYDLYCKPIGGQWAYVHLSNGWRDSLTTTVGVKITSGRYRILDSIHHDRIVPMTDKHEQTREWTRIIG